MSIDATERAELEQLRLANRLSGVATWNFELAGDLTSARMGVGTNVFESIGYASADAPSELGSGLALAIHPDDQTRVFASLRACIDGTTEQFEVEYRTRHKDGSVRWKLGRGVAIRDDSGRPIRITGTSVDVTRLKQVEEDAHIANERLALAADLSGFAITEYDLRGATDREHAVAMIESNKSGQRRWPPLRSSEENFREALLPEDLPRAVAATRASILGATPELHVEYRTRTPDGSVRWRLGRGKCYYDETGAPVRFLGVSIDIQQLKQAQDEMRRAVEQLEVATRLSGVSAWSIDPNGGDLANAKIDRGSAWERLGYETRELPDPSTRVIALVAPEDRERLRSDLQVCIDGKIEQLDTQYRVRHKDGSLRWHLARGVSIRDEAGRVTRVTGTSIDITPLKQVEEEMRAAKDRLDLAAKLVGFTITEVDLRGPVNPEMAIHEAIVPEDLPRAVERFHMLLRPASAQVDLQPALEFRTRSADGSIRWRAGHGKCFFDASGAPIRFLSVTYDIENIKAAEQAARRVAEQLQLTTRLSGVNVWSYDLAGDPDVTRATVRPNNNSVLTSLGHAQSAPSTLHARLLAVVHPDDQERVSTAATDCLTGKTPMLDTECRFVGKDGSVHWKLVRGVVERDPAGRPLLVAGTVVDVAQIKQTQEELRRVQERLERAITGSKACTWDFELTDGQLGSAVAVFTNAWELAGYEVPDDVQQLAQVTAVTMPPEDVEPYLEKAQAFLDGTEREWETELRIVHKDGTPRYHLSRGVVERDAMGRAKRFTGTNIDITVSKHAEKRLLESEERFRRTFENAAVGMILTDVEGRLLEYNARFCEFLGYSHEELAGRNFIELMVPEEAAEDLERQRSVVRGDVASFTRDKRYIRKDGGIVWGNITVSVIQRHADGTPAHVMGILQDITERKELEVEIESGQKRIELALRGSDIAVFHGDFVDPDPANAEWTYFNMWEPLGFGDDPKEFERRKGLALHPDDQALVVEKFAAAVERRSPIWHMEHRVLHRDGSVLWRLSRGTLVYDEAGTMKSLLGTEVDITDLKKIEDELLRAREAAESANRAKDEFLANVSHEIRTPMNAILGMTELALDSAPSEHQRQLLSTVRSAARNLLTIINDLLDFSKIASGKLTLDRAEFSLRAAVGDTLRALAVRAHRKGLELICHVRPDVPDALEGDAGRLRQVLMNLVGNAIKFTARGEVEVDVEAEPSSGSTVAVVFSIRDTGIGIARDKQATIFRAFEQEDASTTRKYGGTGLGLTISAQLAQLMDGEITVQSAPGCGSTFHFTARFARSVRPDTSTVSPERLAQLRVLVVDDNEANRRILVEWLTSWRMVPTSASNAAEALAALATAHADGAPFSLVLLDARMPDTDGVALAGEIRRRWEGRGPRLILLSSDDSAELAALAREGGVLAFLLKPVQQSELLEAIWAVMNLDTTVPSTAGPAGHFPGGSRPLRVLVAEDNELNVTLLRELLSRRGHVAQFARDGRAALELAVQGEFDLMLLDLHMPELDGFEVVAAIRDHERGMDRHLRIIALTARSSARDRERCLAAGMDEFLAKPIEAAALWEVMERLVAEWPLSSPAPKAVERGLLDPRAILRACGGDAGVLDKLRVVFRRSLPMQMSRIRAALTSGNLHDLREAAHQLVGTVGAFSTITAGVASTLEDAAIRDDRESCAALVDRLDSQCKALLDATAALSIDALSL